MSEADGHLFGIVGLAALAMVPATVVVAADYLSVDAAQRAIFPEADAFVPVLPSLTAAQKQHVAALAGPQPQHGTLSIWRAMRGDTAIGYVFVDDVVGRSDLITYALGIDGSGVLRTIEILSYRESHGGEIRNAAWRKQFADRSGLDELVFKSDIKNISGATLSSEHVTQGVRWLVALWQTALARP
jgi:hypothetical protein